VRIARLIAGAAVLLATSGAGAATAAAAGQGAAATASCTEAALTTFAFKPAQVVEGATADLDIAVTSCSAKGFTGSVQTFGRMCKIVLDPLNTPVRITGKHTKKWVEQFTPTCVGSLYINGSLLHDGTGIVTKTAKATIVAG
jgi:hypothetical protein